MRCVARALLLAAVLLVAGCIHSFEPNPVVAKITSITAPDTVVAGVAFGVSVHVLLGRHGGYALEDTVVARSSQLLDLCVWSLDVSRGREVPAALRECDLTFAAGPAQAGEFRITAHQPDGVDTLKTITVLP